MSFDVGSFAVEGGPPDRSGWSGPARDTRTGKPVDAVFLGRLDDADYDRLLAMTPRAAVRRSAIAAVVDLVATREGTFVIVQPSPPGALVFGSGRAAVEALAVMADATARIHEAGIYHGAMASLPGAGAWRSAEGQPLLSGLGYGWLLAGSRPLDWQQGAGDDMAALRAEIGRLIAGPALDALSGAGESVRAEMAALLHLQPPPGGSGARELAVALRRILDAVGAGGAAPAAESGRRTVLLSAEDRRAIAPEGAASPLAAAPVAAERLGTAYLPSGTPAPPGAAPPLAPTVALADVPGLARAGAPTVMAERTVLMDAAPPPLGPAPGAPAGAGTPSAAPTELLSLPPAAAAAGGLAPTVAMPAGGIAALRGPGDAAPAIETIIEHRHEAPAVAARPSRAGRVVLLLAGIFILLLLALGGAAGVWWWLAHRAAATPPAPAAGAGTPPPATPAAPAILEVEAVPWGLAVVAAPAGIELPPTLRGPQPTPLAASLPPGHYVVTLGNPAVGTAAQRCEVDLVAGRTASCRVVLERLTADDYFAAVGWK